MYGRYAVYARKNIYCSIVTDNEMSVVKVYFIEL